VSRWRAHVHDRHTYTLWPAPVGAVPKAQRQRASTRQARKRARESTCNAGNTWGTRCVDGALTPTAPPTTPPTEQIPAHQQTRSLSRRPEQQKGKQAACACPRLPTKRARDSTCNAGNTWGTRCVDGALTPTAPLLHPPQSTYWHNSTRGRRKEGQSNTKVSRRRAHVDNRPTYTL
jgi:hypothetical protein